MMFYKSRIDRERITMERMVTLYCYKNHKPASDRLCPECNDLIKYADERLTHCPFQDRKSTCAKCKVHCYKPDMRQRIREVMVTVGPTMVFRYPILTILHIIDGIAPGKELRKKSFV